jgi:putative ABC transport system permease protein
MKDLFLYAWESIAHKKLRSWLTLLGVLIGITAVVALIGLGDGLRGAVSTIFGTFNPDELSIQAQQGFGAGPPGTGVFNPLTTKNVDDINRLSSVDIAMPQLISTVRLEFNDIQQIGFVQSIPDGDARRALEQSSNFKILDGRLLRDDDRNSVAVGYSFSQNTNSFGKAISVRDRILIDGVPFRVIGVLDKKGSFILDGSILMNEKMVRDLKDNTNTVDIITVRARSIELVPRAKEEIEDYLRRDRGIRRSNTDDFSVQTAEGALDSLNTILNGVQGFIFVIAFISIIVGAVGIANTMFTAVVERQKEIGIMKSIGAKNSDIFSIFVIESGMMGLIGGILGVILGVIISQLGNYGISVFLGSNFLFSINITLIIGALVGSFIVGAVSGVIPALNAARMNPVDAIRK